VFSGIALNFTNPTPSILAIRQRSGWTPGSKTTADVDVSYTDTSAYTYPICFRIEITDTLSGKGFASLSATSATVSTRFRVINVATGEPVPYYLQQSLISRRGFWDRNDPLFIGVRQNDGRYRWVWRLNQIVFLETILPTAGDVYNFISPIPFSADDKYHFRTTASKTVHAAPEPALAKVAVVPNPYLLTASWERGTSMPGRGERKISFIHLPSDCVIRIFTQNGVLIRTIDHYGKMADGTATWDLTTKEGLEVAFGVYVYYIEAKDIGHKIGTFAIIN
jgi:rRNA maturation protein Nop10